MLLEASTIDNTPLRNMANKLGHEIATIPKGSKIQIIDFEKKEDGVWYRCKTGWVYGKHVNIIRDIEFMFKASAMGLLDLQLFSDEPTPKTIVPLQTRSDKRVTKSVANKVNSMLTNKVSGITSNIFGGASKNTRNTISQLSMPPIRLNSSSNGLSKNLFGSVSGGTDTTFGGLVPGSKSGGIIPDPNIISRTHNTSTSFGSGFGRLANDIGLGLSAGISSFLDDLFGNAIDGLFKSIFSRLDYVVGYDSSSMMDSIFNIFGLLDTDQLYDGLFDPYDVYGGSGDDIFGNDYNKWDAIMTEYFKYQGCDGQMIQKSFDNLSWEQDAFYTTPSLESKKVDAEVQFHKTLYNADYSETTDALADAKKHANLNIDRMDWFINFNRYRSTHPDYHLTNTKAYVFFTRPDLNIMDNNSNAMNPDIQKTTLASFFYSMALKHPNICRSLTTSFSGDHDFIPLLSNTARSLDISDESMKTQEHGETLTGWKLVYARHNIESKTAGTFNMNFIDDNEISIYKLHKIWHEYMNGVSRGIISPKKDYIRNLILDYAATVYYFLAAEDGERLLFWTKFLGVFPTNVPSSTFSLTEGKNVSAPDYTMNFSYCFKDDMNPLVLAEFNNNSKKGFSYVPVYNTQTFRCNPTILGAPFIDTSDSGVTYKIRFRGVE